MGEGLKRWGREKGQRGGEEGEGGGEEGERGGEGGERGGEKGDRLHSAFRKCPTFSKEKPHVFQIVPCYFRIASGLCRTISESEISRQNRKKVLVFFIKYLAYIMDFIHFLFFHIDTWHYLWKKLS